MNSIVLATGTGSSQLVTVPPYIDKAHIHVSVDGIETSAFSWVNANTISITATAGAEVKVVRQTSPSVRLVSYGDGTSLPGDVLDLDSKQAFYMAQEALDAWVATAGSSAASVLLQLLDPNRVDGGAGMSIFNASQAYAQGTLGALMLDQAVSVKSYPFMAVGNGVADEKGALDAAIATGKPVYLPPGTYYLSDHVRPPNGSRLVIIGAHRDLVTIKTASGKIPFYCDAAVGGNRITGAFVTGVTFDGGHVRTPANYPYGGDPGASSSQALNLRGSKGASDRGDVLVTRCRFKDFNGLPFWIADFDGSVEVSYNDFYRTKDPGILYCNDVRFVHNTVAFSADNGVSISRSNQRVLVSNNHISDCASSGIFVGGVDVTGSGSVTVAGVSYAVGATVSVSISGATLNTEDQGINITVRNGAQFGVVRITSVTTSTTAVGVVWVAIPAALQNVATSDWSRGPISGGQAVLVTQNTVEGASNYGIRLSSGCKDTIVSNNVVRRTGMTADSEVVTTASVVAGSSTATFSSTTNFAIGDWVVWLPDYTSEDYWLVQISNIVGTAVTLSGPAPSSYANEMVHRAYRRTAAYGIAVTGVYTGPTLFEYAEGVSVHHNEVVDSVTGGIRVGSSSGSVKESQVDHNKILWRQTLHCEATIYGILAGDSGNTAMRTSEVDIERNSISMANYAGSVGIEYKPVDSGAGSQILIDRNRIRKATTQVRVTEQAGPSDITAQYVPSSCLGSTAGVDTLMVGVNSFDNAVAATFNAGVLTVTAGHSTYAAASSITDIAAPSINAPYPVVLIRNTSGSNTITFVNDPNKIRTKAGANYLVPPYGSILLMRTGTAGPWEQMA